jgi:hypothetical protein
MNYYNHYKNLFESVKPIRGRSVDVRPIGKRRRDWEIVRMDGDVVECVLYQTPVVRYYPNGDVGVQCGGWASPSTAEFMYEHSPFVCRKRNRKVQVNPSGRYDEDAKFYPLPEYDEVLFVLTPDNKYAPAAPLVEHKQVIDRKQAKEAREPFMPFIKFMETFLMMSDGWVMSETRGQVGMLDKDRSYFNRAEYDYGFDEFRGSRSADANMLQHIAEAQEDDYLRAMCMFLDRCITNERVLVKSIEVGMGGDSHPYKKTVRFYNTRYNLKSVKAKLYRMIARECDVFVQKEVTHV